MNQAGAFAVHQNGQQPENYIGISVVHGQTGGNGNGATFSGIQGIHHILNTVEGFFTAASSYLEQLQGLCGKGRAAHAQEQSEGQNTAQ